MPIEISEIAIQMRVRDEPGGPSDDAAGRSPRLSTTEREALVTDCVARVLAALRTRQER